MPHKVLQIKLIQRKQVIQIKGAHTEAVQHNKAAAVHITERCAHVNSQIGHRQRPTAELQRHFEVLESTAALNKIAACQDTVCTVAVQPSLLLAEFCIPGSFSVCPYQICKATGDISMHQTNHANDANQESLHVQHTAHESYKICLQSSHIWPV